MTGFRLVAVLHLPPLPGAANYRGASVRAIARTAAEDATVLALAGFTDVMIQDASDNPQPETVGPATVAALAVIGAAVRAALDTHNAAAPQNERAAAAPPQTRLGVVVGHNDGPAAVAIAHAIDAEFVRVKVLTGVSVGPTGWIEGCSLQVAQLKRQLGSSVEVWADVHEATSLALTGSLAWAAAQSRDFGGADKLIVTRDSGVADALGDIAQLKAAFGGSVDLLIGGRVSTGTLEAAIRGCDGAILGSAIKTGPGFDARIDPVAAQAFGAILTRTHHQKASTR